MEMGHEPKLSMLLGLAPTLRAGVCKEGQHPAPGEAVEKQELLLPSPLLDGSKCPHSTLSNIFSTQLSAKLASRQNYVSGGC